MTGEEATLAVIDALNDLSIPYMLVGSLSSNHYAIPRSTQDADFVVELAAHSVSSIAHRLTPSLRLEPQMSFETVTGTNRHEFTVVDDPFKIELFELSSDAHDQERFRRRVSTRVLGRVAFVPTAEDVIITKLRWARPKDRDDVRDVIAVQADRIDWTYVEPWCDRHETRTLLEEIRGSIPPL
jgi:hypothetical protein